MFVRLGLAVLLLLSVPLFSQQPLPIQQVPQKMDGMIRPGTPGLDPRLAQLAAIQQDATELSTLSGSVQSDLQQLQKGVLAKDLQQRLKKMEKLCKKLRQEMEP
jgi:hypothetical protein